MLPMHTDGRGEEPQETLDFMPKLPAVRLQVAAAPHRPQLGPELGRGHPRPLTNRQASRDPVVDTKSHRKTTHSGPPAPLPTKPWAGSQSQHCLFSIHHQATIVSCHQLCHNLSSPPQTSSPHTTTFNPQPPPGISQESFLSCLQSRQDRPLTWNSLYLLRTPIYLPVDGPRQRRDSQLSRDSSRPRTGNLDTKGEMSYSHLSHLDAYSTYPPLSSSVTS